MLEEFSPGLELDYFQMQFFQTQMMLNIYKLYTTETVNINQSDQLLHFQ